MGVNVRKDVAYAGQDAAVHSAAVHDLLVRADAVDEPSREVVERFLARLQREYLDRPVQARVDVSDLDVIPLWNLPVVEQLLVAIAKARGNPQTPDAAAMGMVFAGLSGGALLDTVSSPRVAKDVLTCVQLSEAVRAESPAASLPDCKAFAIRGLVWDLVAASLQWDGAAAYSVGRIEEVDARTRLYRVRVRRQGESREIPIYVSFQHGEPRLSLLDENGGLYAIDPSPAIDASELAGAWRRNGERQKIVATGSSLERVNDEWLSISPFPGGVAVRHSVQTSLQATPGRVFTCNRESRASVIAEQSFVGTIQGRALRAEPTRSLQRGGDSCACGDLCYSEDRQVVLKRFGDRLLMLRTTGAHWPEVAVFERSSPFEGAPTRAASPSAHSPSRDLDRSSEESCGSDPAFCARTAAARELVTDPCKAERTLRSFAGSGGDRWSREMHGVAREQCARSRRQRR